VELASHQPTSTPFESTTGEQHRCLVGDLRSCSKSTTSGATMQAAPMDGSSRC
jgi:hypothetical protein